MASLSYARSELNNAMSLTCHVGTLFQASSNKMVTLKSHDFGQPLRVTGPPVAVHSGPRLALRSVPQRAPRCGRAPCKSGRTWTWRIAVSLCSCRGGRSTQANAEPSSTAHLGHRRVEADTNATDGDALKYHISVLKIKCSCIYSTHWWLLSLPEPPLLSSFSPRVLFLFIFIFLQAL